MKFPPFCPFQGEVALRLRRSAQQKHGMFLSPKRFLPQLSGKQAVWGWVGRLRRFCGELTPGHDDIDSDQGTAYRASP
jgi:hypothetical protein